MVAVIQIAIACGFTIGGIAFDGVDLVYGFAGSAMILILSAAASIMLAKLIGKHSVSIQSR
ncbi:hypothetical protein D6851_07095 [Altericroceibacterium spongiae]|uniref:Uncharacterized protein n=1 Tax=Altericroceibacterium spongiae TaxID=2320269 RepID=A0A420EMA7_9SPHN|nr:hypothetical protein [Altericroceibacterium spongiae]RKF21780.1 hypothetical protein D6851_07095 [Altericroceibacterium spongiae]